MRRALGGIPLLVTAGPAFASGGAHVVDDAAVETPGTCHLESWATLSSGAGLINASPACTRRQWPNLELGGFVAHDWTRGSNDTLIGLLPKLMLRSEERGIGIGIATSLGYSAERVRVQTASLIVPLTIPVDNAVRINLNAGWQRTRAGELFRSD